MKFDFVIGNPPYQEDRQGSSNTALPVYHDFMDAAYSVGNAIELITPARFLFDAGRTPKEWNKKMLGDKHLKVLEYTQNASSIFPNTEIKGGVVITYRDISKEFDPIEIFITDSEMNSIVHKIIRNINSDSSLASLGFVANKFNMENLVKDYPDYKGHERRLSSNVLSFACFTDERKSGHYVGIYGVVKGKRIFRYIDFKYIDDSKGSNIDKYKIIVPKADGNGLFGDRITNPEILEPDTGFTHTFLGFGGFDSRKEAENAIKYIKTKFARALLSVLKVTQDNNADKWKYVPLQDFTENSDIDWSKTIHEIDLQLYRKYGLSVEEIDFIEKNVKEMV